MTVEPIGASDTGPCACCGQMSRTVWGCLHDNGVPVAAYYVHWTLGRLDHGANVDLVIGPWGEGSSSADRTVVAAEFRGTRDGPQFMVIDAPERPAARNPEIAGSAKSRHEVIGTPLAPKVYAMLDAIWLGDDRIVELTRPAA